ncbi:hypothetical protein RB620_07210 [Paenibacillus sp. LHD-117]|uniref:hypothetical protein n=1 Tax=Paenibacillus sp. LHD-117 TaxID=3071412 RepID=UPI0027E20958|nr:hypothetical protein [Paenibacillus sp. LHD-117]MDQ6419228.1 hypothetical protein [Paenibacillus sp. LHD-117]
MFNKRSFVLGLGIGMIVGAMLLQLFYLGEDSQKQLDQIGQQVEQGGLRSAELTPTSGTEPESTEQPTAQPSPKVTEPPPTKQPEASAEPAKEDLSASDPFVVRIEPGMSLTETAELLAQAGAISEPNPFIDEMKSSGLRVRAGYFLFAKGPVDAKEAAAIVSGEPISEKN